MSAQEYLNNGESTEASAAKLAIRERTRRNNKFRRFLAGIALTGGALAAIGNSDLVDKKPDATEVSSSDIMDLIGASMIGVSALAAAYHTKRARDKNLKTLDHNLRDNNVIRRYDSLTKFVPLVNLPEEGELNKSLLRGAAAFRKGASVEAQALVVNLLAASAAHKVVSGLLNISEAMPSLGVRMFTLALGGLGIYHAVDVNKSMGEQMEAACGIIDAVKDGC